jgi:arsenite oxidase small subunit
MTHKTETLEADASQLPSKADHPPGSCLMSRRNFLLSSGVASATVMVTINSGGAAANVPGVMVTYPRMKIATLSALKTDTPVGFEYPDKGAYAQSMLVKLGTEAGGGVGPQKDVVAFNFFCTHQGGDLSGTYKGETKSLGACPLHLSTYDLTRHGILISGQAYQSLPQVLLELKGDDIYAVGVFGLIYGRYDNMQG